MLRRAAVKIGREIDKSQKGFDLKRRLITSSSLNSEYALTNIEFKFPEFGSLRVMMMPFDWNDPEKTIPTEFGEWKESVVNLVNQIGIKFPKDYSIGYLTIDQGVQQKGKTLRRPEAHCDGKGSWGGASWGGVNADPRAMLSVENALDALGEDVQMSGVGTGCFLATRIIGSNRSSTMLYRGPLVGRFGPDGSADHLVGTLMNKLLPPAQVVWLDPLAVHAAIPSKGDEVKQVIRLSGPSDSVWYRGYTENPLGIKPAGNIVSGREEQMSYNR